LQLIPDHFVIWNHGGTFGVEMYVNDVLNF